jgi:hypothetical protein
LRYESCVGVSTIVLVVVFSFGCQLRETGCSTVRIIVNQVVSRLLGTSMRANKE